MSNEVAAQKAAGGLKFQLPAHLAARMAAAGGGNMQAREGGVNQVSYKDGVFSIRFNGDTKKMERLNEETGEMEAVPVLHAIVLSQGAWSRNLYPAYDEGNPSGPDCWSEGGRKPHASVDKPPATSCDICPMSQKGSRPTASYADGTACKSFQLLALQLVKFDAQSNPQFEVNHDAPALRLKLAPTGLYDAQDKAAQAQGWFAWRQYTDFLTANGVQYSSSVITRIRGSGKKVQFKLVAFTEPDDFDRTLVTAETDEVKKLLEFSISGKGKPGKALPQADAPVDGPGDFPPPGNAAEEAVLRAGYAAEAQAKQAAQAKAKEAEAKAEADLAAADKAAAALIAAKLEADTKAARKAAKVAAAQAAAAAAVEAARLAAEADSEDEDGWDEPATAAAPTAPVTPPAALDGEVLPPADSPAPVKPKPARRTAAPETPVAPVEVPASLASCLPAWDD